MKRTVLLCVVVICLAASLVAGCGKGRAPESTLPTKETKQELIVAVGISTIGVEDVWSHKAVNCLVYESLVTVDNNGQVKPLLAESYKVSEDGKEYTFHLRRGIKFSDGTPFNAQAVKASFEYMLRDRPESVLPVQSVDVVDEYTVKYTLIFPYFLFLHDMARAFFPGAMVRPSPEAKVTPYVGTGPFVFKEYVRPQYYTLVKNENYWQGEVKLDKITFREIPDAHTRVLALEAGEVDVIGVDTFSRVPSEDISRLRDNPEFAVHRLPILDNPAVHFIVVNYKKEPFDDLKVRKAIRYAINGEEVDAVLGEAARTVDGPIPDDCLYFNPKVNNCYPYDPERARELLAAAGWKDADGDGILDKSGKPFKVTLKFHAQTPEWPKIAKVVQAQLKKVGIDITLQQLEWGTHVDAVKSYDFDMIFWPQMAYHMFYYSKRSWLNLFKGEELDRQFEQYFSSLDPEKRREAYYKTQEIIVENAPMVLYYQQYHVLVASKKVQNLELNPTSWNLLKHVWKAYVKTE